MVCAKCGKNNIKGARFCEDCGTKLENKIKKELPTGSTSENGRSSRMTTSANNISDSNENVKSNISNKYDMQKVQKDTKELDNSSRSSQTKRKCTKICTKRYAKL